MREKLDYFFLNKETRKQTETRGQGVGSPGSGPGLTSLELMARENPMPCSGRDFDAGTVFISDFQPPSPKPQLSDRDPLGSSPADFLQAEERGLGGCDSPKTHIITRQGDSLVKNGGRIKGGNEGNRID